MCEENLPYVEKKKVIAIVKRLIELKQEYWDNSNKNTPPIKFFLLGKSKGIEKALDVIDQLANNEYMNQIHELIDESKTRF